MDNRDALVAGPARQRPWGLERVGPPVPAGAVPAPSAASPALRPAALPASAAATLKLALLPHRTATVQKIFAIYEGGRGPPKQDVAVEAASSTTAAGFANRHLPRTTGGRGNSRHPRRVRACCGGWRSLVASSKTLEVQGEQCNKLGGFNYNARSRQNCNAHEGPRLPATLGKACAVCRHPNARWRETQVDVGQ